MREDYSLPGPPRLYPGCNSSKSLIAGGHVPSIDRRGGQETKGRKSLSYMVSALGLFSRNRGGHAPRLRGAKGRESRQASKKKGRSDWLRPFL